MVQHFPETMSEHDKTLLEFIELFNETKPMDVVMRLNTEEYVEDGFISINGREVSFDWQKKYDKNFTKDYFPFNTLRCFNRKWYFNVDIIIIQNRLKTAIVVAWHKDFGKPFETILSSKEGLVLDKVRETDKFLTIGMDNLQILKDVLMYGLIKNE